MPEAIAALGLRYQLMTTRVLDEAKVPRRFGPQTLPSIESRETRLIGPRELLSLFRRHFRLILGCGALGVGLSLFALSVVPNSYRAQSMILLQPDDPNLLEETEQSTAPQQPNRSMMDTEADLMMSRMFIGLVVDELNLIAEPDFNSYLPQSGAIDQERAGGLLRVVKWLPRALVGLGPSSDGDALPPLPDSKVQRDRAITALLSMLSITRTGESSVMEVSVVDGDPYRAATLADGITRLFVEWTRDQKRDDMRQAADYLRQQAGELATRIAKLEQQIADYGRQHQVSNDPRDDLLRLAMQQANEQLSVARGDLTQSHARLAQVKDAATGALSDGDSILTSELQTTLRSEEAAALRDRAELARNRGVNHPLVQEADAKILSIREAIAKEMGRLVASLGGDVRIAEERVKEVAEQLAAAERELRQRSLAEIKLRELNRDLLTEQRLYDVVAARLGKLDPFARVAEPGARVVSRAEVPTVPYFPKPRMILGASLVGSLVLGFLLAVTLESLDSRVRDGRRAANLVRGPLLGSIPKLRRRLGKPRPDLVEHLVRCPRSPVADAFRTLFHACRRAGSTSRNQVLFLASGMPGEGSSAAATGLAVTAAQMGLRTLLLDCDPRARGRPASLPTTSSRSGAQSLISDGNPPQAPQPMPTVANLFVITIDDDQLGIWADAHAERFKRLLEITRNTHDLVVINAPPVLVLEEAAWIAAHADAAVLVAAWDRTTEETLIQASETFRTGGARLAGLVLTQTRPSVAAQYGAARPAKDPSR